ncbi:hypothetical protein [Salinivibrio kushneri]|uniref:hypothetical protein n=1 Tax=Salinivibrio kushneri TaxID=1908198 RepID=UPI0022B406AF|nr:hypothetical protein [Salinivibrio kushneri]WBA10763.1 hypothetical protein O4546_07885 [Salinivibrio kushneri]
MNLDYSEIPNQAILASAKKYLLSAELIESQNGQLELGSILCSSFSIELLLKSLLSMSSPQNIEQLDEGSWTYTCVNHTTAHGHCYSKLFDELTSQHRSYLSSFFNPENEIESLESMLKAFDNTFIKWRYGYETTNKPINVTLLLRLNRKLYDAIENMEIVREFNT